MDSGFRAYLHIGKASVLSSLLTHNPPPPPRVFTALNLRIPLQKPEKGREGVWEFSKIGDPNIVP